MVEANLEAVLGRLDALSEQVAYLVERQRKQEELLAEALPIAKEVLKTATSKLDELERAGYFTFGRELLHVLDGVVKSYGADDVRQLGEAATSILNTVRAMTQPEVLAVAGEAAEVITHADRTQPIGLLGMVRATRSDEVQRGMAVMMELLRKVGKGAQALAEGKNGRDEKRERFNALLAPKKRQEKKLGFEPPVVPARTVIKAPAPATTVIDGVVFGADGHLADPAQWTQKLADTLALALGVELSEAHWKVVEFARGDFEAKKAAPNIRRITQELGVSTKDLYALFPKAPARTIAKIAGIPKPAGCL